MLKPTVVGISIALISFLGWLFSPFLINCSEAWLPTVWQAIFITTLQQSRLAAIPHHPYRPYLGRHSAPFSAWLDVCPSRWIWLGRRQQHKARHRADPVPPPVPCVPTPSPQELGHESCSDDQADKCCSMELPPFLAF